jgi:hypothetical protein
MVSPEPHVWCPRNPIPEIVRRYCPTPRFVPEAPRRSPSSSAIVVSKSREMSLGGDKLREFLMKISTSHFTWRRFLGFRTVRPRDADRILLRQVGGGYMFMHRMLLEHFAARYVEPGTIPKKDPSSGEHQPA